MTKTRLSGPRYRWLLLCAWVSVAHAAQTDLANAPLITSAPQAVLPNLMFILDDSGSMAWSYMPDEANDFNGDYGYASSQCNGVYYNPNIVYRPPVDANGTSYSNSSITAAWINGFDTSAGTVNLTTDFRPSGSYTAQAAFYYAYSGSQTTEALKSYLNSSSTFYRECNSGISSTPGSNVFTKVVVSSTSGPPGRADERTNFANWYSYYRTRMLTMKTSTGLAFRTIDDRYRIGYMSINNNVSPSFLNFAAFDSTQKTAWYAKLYGASPDNSTPLREALSRAGRIFAGQQTSLYGATVTDPVQYSCQKNFALLSTDGYWNGNDGFQLDGSTAVGNQDSGEPRPFNDGGSVADIYTATITVGGDSNTTVNSITVGGSQILSGAANSSGARTRARNLAQNIAASINNCTSAITGNCAVAGFSAVRSGSVVTLTAPGAVSGSPVITISTGAMTVTPTAFTASSVSTAGTSDTLADVADYYYKTDLRSTALGNQTGILGTDVTANNVLSSGDDDATWQHMTTFTLGLGARGRMIYTPDYKTATSGDYFDVANGSTASGSVCTWQASGACNWPTPGADRPENIDDLWHAAVNGRGSYFSATDPASLAVGLTGALQGISALTSDAAAATTSNPNVTAGDNYIFSSTFRSAEWYGDLERRQIDVNTGDEAATADWQARAQLDANTTRTIYTYDATNVASRLKVFAWDNLTTGEQAYFSTPYISTTASPVLSQFCASGDICLTAANQALASGQPLVDFIRGDRSNEGLANQTAKYFRARTSVLGDIVNSEAVYVKKPQFTYVDAGYNDFKTSAPIVSRPGMVYVGANDGMLHAFYADTGEEAWAYVPNLLLPSLYKLADKYYATKHQYYVDGSPTQADVYFGGAWHTILVGGFNSGGRGYYALDITDPASPKALWEFTDANMGLSYGRPEITKLKDGTWVVLFTSGYNNVAPGDGQGYLYVVNAGTGVLVRAIPTGAGSTAAVAGICAVAPCPSGLAQIRAWVENTAFDNTTTRVYGGDLFGNVWRFDVNGDVGASGYDAQILATLRGTSGNVQSVTSKPELGKVAGNAVVFVGTGRYLGTTDLSDSSQQSIYAIKDPLGSTGYGNPRLDAAFIQQTLTNGTCPASSLFCNAGDAVRTATSNAVNFAINHGWFIDLPGTRERANTDPQLALGTLAVTTNLLNPSACTVGGTSFINYFDYRTGSAVTTADGIVSLSLGNALATRPVQIKLADGTVRSLIRLSDNTWQTPQTPIAPPAASTRRTSWRELVTE